MTEPPWNRPSDFDWFNFNLKNEKERKAWNETPRSSSDSQHFMGFNDFSLLCFRCSTRMSNRTWWFPFSSCMWSHALSTLQYHTQENWELFSVRALMGDQNVLSWTVHAERATELVGFLFSRWLSVLKASKPQKSDFYIATGNSKIDFRCEISLFKRLELPRPLQASQRGKMFVISGWSRKEVFPGKAGGK